MKTIWLVNPYGPIEGENWREYSFNQFGKYLSQNGFKVVWWTANFSHHFKQFRSEGWKDIPVNEGFVIRLVPTISYKKNIGVKRFLKDFVFGKNVLERCKTEEKPDIIVAAENPLCMGKPAFEYAHKNNVPIIYDQMDIWPEFLIKVLPSPISKIADLFLIPVYRKRKKIYQLLDGSIALSKNYLDFMFRIAPDLQKKPNAIIYNGIDVDEFRTHLDDPINEEKIKIEKGSNDIWCIFAGSLGPSYDIQSIVKCAYAFHDKGIDEFKFIIAGSGPQEPLVKAANDQLDNFLYVGKLLPEELIPIYGRCDIGLSTYSSGSNVDMCDKFYDYTAAGLSIINSLTGEVSEHIEKNQLGINYVANDQESLKNALLKFRDKDYLAKTKSNSLRVGGDFDMKVQNRRLLEIIEKVLRK